MKYRLTYLIQSAFLGFLGWITYEGYKMNDERLLCVGSFLLGCLIMACIKTDDENNSKQ